MLTEGDLPRLKGMPAAWRSRVDVLAGRALREGPWSVTFHRPRDVEVPRNAYYSDAPYWWPDPKNPKGPYIRKDGEHYPYRFTVNHRDLGLMSEAVLALALANAQTPDARWGRRAAEILRVWFLDPATRMTPHLEHAQAVRQRDTGRNAGIIDGRSLLWCAQGLLLLEGAPGFDPQTGAQVRAWFAEYLRWLTTSEKGVKESQAGNNHAAWWTVQAAGHAILTGDAKTEAACWRHYREVLVPGQFRPDGPAPKEEARTRSLHYSAMNLDAFTVLARLAQLRGVDLWRFQAPSGASVLRSIEYLLPYWEKPAAWKKPQITAFRREENYFLGLAGLGIQRPAWVKRQLETLRADSAWLLIVEAALRISTA